MNLIPISLREANDFIESFHRHNGRTQMDGGKYAIGLAQEDELVGVAIVGRPLSRMLQDGFTAEVRRLCVRDEAEKGACSMLYQACWRAWRSMGGRKLITYTLKSESGASLRGAGWQVIGEIATQSWHRPGRPREWQPIYGQQKLKWERV